MKFFKKIFRLNGRLDRKGYLLLGILPLIGVISFLSYFSLFEHSTSSILGLSIFLLVWILTLVSAIKRGRDSGLGGFMSLFLFVTVPMLIVDLESSMNLYYPYIAGVFIVYLLLMPSSSKEIKPIGKIEYGFITIFMGLASLMWINFVFPKNCIESKYAMKVIMCTQMESIARVLDTFKMDNGVYPSTKEGIEALISNPDVLKYANYPKKPYFKGFPKDGWGDRFVYVKTKEGFELISYGADRKEGGEDEGADIFYSECGK